MSEWIGEGCSGGECSGHMSIASSALPHERVVIIAVPLTEVAELGGILEKQYHQTILYICLYHNKTRTPWSSAILPGHCRATLIDELRSESGAELLFHSR